MKKKSTVDDFIEKHNMTYLFLLLANLEVDRLSNLPYTVRKNFNEKITKMALKHIAANQIPDYIIEQSLDLTENPAEE
jgi:hypothetical protein